MAAPILKLPFEILYMIFAPLEPRDLHAVCLTYRDWNSLAEPFLYNHIQWTWTHSHNPPIIQFLRTIVHRPELARFVHVLTLRGVGFDKNSTGRRTKSPSIPVAKTDLEGLVKCIEGLCVPYAQEWVQHLCAGVMDAFVTLLLSQLPSLRHLYMGKNFAREIRLVGMMLRSALCERSQDSNLSSFTHLQYVEAVHDCPDIRTHQYTDYRDTADILPLFYLPSVKQIRVRMDNPTKFMWPGQCPPNPLTLTSLDLTLLREGHLGQVLSVTRGLQKLDWDWYYRDDREDRFVTDIIDLDQIASDLSHVQETLTDLTITAGSDPVTADPWPPRLTFRGSFKTFSGLHKLQRLEVPIPFLFPFSPGVPNVIGLGEALPQNIQWLTVTDDLCLQDEWEWEYGVECHLLRVIQAWLRDWKIFTPHLQGFCLSMGINKVRDWEPAFIQGLRDIGAQTGVQIQIIEKEKVKMPGTMD